MCWKRGFWKCKRRRYPPNRRRRVPIEGEHQSNSQKTIKGTTGQDSSCWFSDSLSVPSLFPLCHRSHSHTPSLTVSISLCLCLCLSHAHSVSRTLSLCLSLGVVHVSISDELRTNVYLHPRAACRWPRRWPQVTGCVTPIVSNSRQDYCHLLCWFKQQSASRRGGPANQCNRIISQHHTTKHERKVHKMCKI